MPGVPWWRSAAFYHIYPASYMDGDGDGFGDLAGIASRLDHLAGAPHSLGVDALWLSPFYRSPMVDFGYDVADHCAVDPRFGTLAAFDALLAAAHARHLRLIVDFVPNHTSDQHPWFQESRRSRDDPRRDWYVWADPRPDGSPPNNWLSAFPRSGAAWTLDEATGQYYLHSYTPQQPDLNWRNPAVQTAMRDVLRFWLDRGVDGFRVDAPHRLMKDPGLRDNPPEVAALRLDENLLDTARHRNIDHPDVHEIVRSLRATVDAYPDRVLLGEIGIRHPQRWARYYGLADHDGVQLAFNFAFWGCPWSAQAFREVVERTEQIVPPWAWPTYALSNHDIPRAATRYGEARMRLAAMLLLTLRGTPFLYYGEEIGMRDVPIPPAQARDPDGRDPCRTPMQWDGSHAAGFTTGQPWLPVATMPDAATESRDPHSLLNLYRALLRLRAGCRPLREGSYHPLDSGDRVLAFERRAGDERVLVALNFGAEPASVEAFVPGAATRLLSTVPGGGEAGWLAPYEGAIFRL
jgi:alpha-glucosidase